MRLLDTTSLQESFKKLVTDCDQVDIAVAWATPCDAVRELQYAARGKRTHFRVAVGISGNATHPAVLHSLNKSCNLRVVDRSPTLFHPKFYRFQVGKESICWMGSSNLTYGGFGTNEELVHEFIDPGYAREWFESFWAELDPRTASLIRKYEDRYVPPKPAVRRSSLSGRNRQKHPFSLLENQNNQTWGQYVESIRKCDAYWIERAKDDDHHTVLGETWSYLHTIAAGHDLLLRDDWKSFTSHEQYILLGHKPTGGAWGLLGSMKSAGNAKEAFNDPGSSDTRKYIRDIVHEVAFAPADDIVELSTRAIEKICQINGFGPGVATRLLALARPDYLVSINDESRRGLAQLAGRLPTTTSALTNTKNYPKLLRWIHNQPWFQAAPPTNSFELSIWKRRAALLDAFVYKSFSA